MAVIQYPNGDRSLAFGTISAVNDTNLFYHISTNFGSSGSPVILLSGEAVGLHTSVNWVVSDEDGTSRRKGIRLDAIVFYFFSHEGCALCASVNYYYEVLYYSCTVL